MAQNVAFLVTALLLYCQPSPWTPPAAPLKHLEQSTWPIDLIGESSSTPSRWINHLGRGRMIKAVLVMNTQGKPRLAKFYEFRPVEKRQELIRNVFSVLCSRAENVSSFVDAESIFGCSPCLQALCNFILCVHI
ncbi:uncharacterized protein LOC129311974 isoform X4 [Prosopis cineraria]|uniref:uncharacterized protein LOC129311974 isoform X4 n=1 Tax=Prosopis cineraria TaxID=364024 RepID=UPI00240EC452|nr:uncharacterized protein LOC129311974 isoform X4 [Prosopis cineraria]